MIRADAAGAPSGAAEAAGLFYQEAKEAMGAFAAALSSLDTLLEQENPR